MIRFYAEELLAPRPTPKLEDHTLSAVRNYLFNIFAVTLHIGRRSSIRNLRTRHAVVTGTHLPRNFLVREYKSLGSPGKRREEDNKMFFFRRSRLRVIYWTVGSMHRFWYKLCRSDRICHSNISGLEGAPSRPIQYYMHRNTELFLRNLPCDNSLMVYHADNSKYSPQHFTF